MNKLRERLLKSKAYFFPIFIVVSLALSYLLSSFLGKAKPIEKFSIFISGIDFNQEVLRERINSYRTNEYDYLLVFNADIINEDDDASYYSYDYQFENSAVPNYDLIIYPQTYFEEAYTSDAYAGHFNVIKNPNSSWDMINEYAVKIHDKGGASNDEILGITFKEDNYLISINNRTVHDSDNSDAARHFLEAFIHE